MVSFARIYHYTAVKSTRNLSLLRRDPRLLLRNVHLPLRPLNRLINSSADQQDRKRLRNIGLVAHINAGKTTTTERILYYAGSTDTVGDVDRGNTVTDYLIQERDRGITITSAAVTLNWNRHKINLIDTPGHVDFTIEVERSLSVLDGAVTILDASAGVEAQTITVWNQATKYKLPNIVLLNKYDKPQADYKVCLDDLQSDLGIQTKLIQLPVKDKRGHFTSLIDVINRRYLSWINPEQNKGTNLSALPISDAGLDVRLIEQVEEEREKLVHALTDTDENLASHLIECDRIKDVSAQLITKAMRQAVIGCKLTPVLIGSSFKYIGIQPLMDAIVDFLPSPIDRQNQIRNLLSCELENEKNSDNCAVIFKIMHDKRLGCLSYVRVYNGQLTKLQRFLNLNSNTIEQAKRIYRVFADELREIDKPVHKDDIVVLTGLTSSRTGDILVDLNFKQRQARPSSLSDSAAQNESKGIKTKSPFQLLNQHIVVPQISQLEPVFFCSIEALNVSHQLKLEKALDCMSREDPSFTYDINSLGITTIRGMGKLHLEIARDRIKTEYGIDSLLGPLQISYRETIEGSANEEIDVKRLINSVNHSLSLSLYVRSKPGSGAWSGKMLRLDSSSESNLGKLRSDHRKAIEAGFVSALSHGPTLGYPMIDCDVLLLDFKANSRCSAPVISSAASQCLRQAISRCSPVLLEPIMLLEIVGPTKFNGSILSDLTSRRGIIVSTQARGNGSIVIKSHTPLSMLADYSEYLRITTSGRATFSMELHNYATVSAADVHKIVRV